VPWGRREDIEFELKTPGGERIALIAVPSDIREEALESAKMPRAIQPGSIIEERPRFIGGGIRTATSPKAPAAATI